MEAEVSSLLPRIRVICANEPHTGFLLSQRLLPKVLKDEAFVDHAGEEWEPIGQAPTTVIGDVTMGHLLIPIREDHQFKLLLWWGGSASSFVRMYGPPERGGRAGYQDECMEVFRDETLRNGRSFDEIARDVAFRSSRIPDDIVRLTGLVPYFQWEDWPQETWNSFLYGVLCKCQELATLADGLLLGTVIELGPEATADIVQYMHPRRLLCLGPQITFTSEDAGRDPTIAFLDDALLKQCWACLGPVHLIRFRVLSSARKCSALGGYLTKRRTTRAIRLHHTSCTTRPGPATEGRAKR